MTAKRDTRTPESRAWAAMRSRCSDRNGKPYSRYGGRGITVCERWSSFDMFLADMGPRPSAKHSLDRIDVNGNYCPENCRWATMTEQQNNRTSNIWIEAFGKRMTLQRWAEEVGVHHTTLRNRLKRMTAEAALTHKWGRHTTGLRRRRTNPDQRTADDES